MSDNSDGHESIEKARELLDKVISTKDDEELANLSNVVKRTIQELISTSYPNPPNPGIYKILNDASRHINDRTSVKTAKSAFSFKSFNRFKANPTIEKQTQEVQNDEKNTIAEPVLTFGNHYIIKNLKNERLTRLDTTDVVGSIRLENVENCRVVILNVVESVYMSNIVKSIVWISTTKSSVIMDSIKNSTIITTCRQLRVANSLDCRFCVSSVTAPIIETCVGMIFSSNHLRYSNYEEDIKKSGLEDFARNEKIVDFSCHYENKTPNWCIIEDYPEHKVEIMKEEGSYNNNINLTDNDWLMLKSL